MRQSQPAKEQTRAVFQTRRDCRMCGSEKLVQVLSLGETPLANAYVDPSNAAQTDVTVPLNVHRCADCHLLQLRDVVDPDVLFENYLYVSSTSPTFVAHFQEYADTLAERFKLTERDLVVDVGSNDGVLLKPLQKRGVTVLGVDPAANIAAQANADGIPTIPAFFTPGIAQKIRGEHGPATVITANNVFAHTDDVDTFTQAVAQLLAPNGVFVFEVQYLGDLLANNLFDIIYHEHVCYYHLHPLVSFFKRHGLEVFDVEQVAAHGGSIRVYVQRAGAKHEQSERLAQLLQTEEAQGLNTSQPYLDLAERISRNKATLHALLHSLKQAGHTIAGYGAPAKATTLMSVFGLDGAVLDYIVDDALLKQGRLMPGTRIPIVSADHLQANPPDYCLVLAWNFADPIMRNQAGFAQAGGKWIVPVPETRVI